MCVSVVIKDNSVAPCWDFNGFWPTMKLCRYIWHTHTHTILHCTSAHFIAFDVRGQYKAFLRGDDADACNILGCHGFSS